MTLTNFDKALEVEKKIEEASENFKLSDIPYPPLKNIFKAGCEHGYTLGRDFTIAEVCKLLRDNYINGGKGMADFLEQHFKDRGTK